MDITKGKGQREEGGMNRPEIAALHGFLPPIPRFFLFRPAVKKPALKIFTLKFPDPSFSEIFPRLGGT
jgi:hypothetical protein